MTLSRNFNWRPSTWRTQRWFRPIPYRGWEMLIMRLLFALVVYAAFPNQVPFSAAKYEVGIARLMPLTWLADPRALELCRWILIAALCLYASGRCLVLALPVMAFLTIAPATLANSQGAFHHHLQVLGLVLVAQWIWFSYRAIAAGEVLKPGRRTHVLNVFYSQQVIVATYLTTAIWKLWKTKLGWIREAKYFPVQLVKTRDAHYYNKLEHAAPDATGLAGKIDAWFAAMTPHLETFLFAHPNLCRLVIGVRLVPGAARVPSADRAALAPALRWTTDHVPPDHRARDESRLRIQHLPAADLLREPALVVRSDQFAN